MDLSFQKIADMHNHYLDKLRAQCKTCYMSQSCMQCMYTINQLDSSEKIKCPGFTNREDFARYVFGVPYTVIQEALTREDVMRNIRQLMKE